MDINLWRSGLKTWLNSKLLVDTWELRNPYAYGTVNAFLPPLQNLTFMDGMVGEATAIQDVYLTSKYPGETKYDQLPVGTLEQKYVSIQKKLATEYTTICPLTALEMLTVPDAIQVSEDGEGMADWLVTLVLSCKITWVPSDTLLPGENPVIVNPITSLNIGLFKGLLAYTNPQAPEYEKDFRDPLRRDKVGNIPGVTL